MIIMAFLLVNYLFRGSLILLAVDVFFVLMLMLSIDEKNFRPSKINN